MSRELGRGCTNLCYSFACFVKCWTISLTFKSTLKVGEVNCCSRHYPTSTLCSVLGWRRHTEPLQWTVQQVAMFYGGGRLSLVERLKEPGQSYRWQEEVPTLNLSPPVSRVRAHAAGQRSAMDGLVDRKGPTSSLTWEVVYAWAQVTLLLIPAWGLQEHPLKTDMAAVQMQSRENACHLGLLKKN